MIRPDPGIDTTAALEFLYEELSPRLLNIVLNAKRGQVQKWIADPSLMSLETKKLVSSLYDVVSILRSYISQRETKLWMVDHSDFLFGIPAKDIRFRPEDVRMAALNRVSRGEHYELWRENGTQEVATVDRSAEES